MKLLLKFLSVSLLATFLSAEDVKEGTLSVLLFHNGTALSGNEVKIDARRSLHTDEDGLAQAKLTMGKHQIEIYGKDKQGHSLGYFKKQIMIEEGKDTQVIASLSQKGGGNIDVDVPVKSMKKDEAQKEAVVTGTGTLKGIILSSQGGTPIEGARIFVRGTSVDTRTDASGRFTANVPSGTPLSISVVHSAYSAQTVSNISVQKGGVASRTVKLTPASMELEEFVVLAPKIEGSIGDTITEEKNINAIANILGSEELSKKGDSDAASALKRVTGITLVGGRDIYVRGLGERYSNIEMNSLPLPSPDPTKRVVPLDIFPASVIDSMKVQKSATADIPSGFGGGYIDIRTKDITKESYINISLGVKGNSNTGKDSNNYAGSSTDWIGYDDGYRAIVSSILNAGEVHIGERVPGFTTDYFTKDELVTFTKDYVDRDYNIEQRNLPIGMNGSIEAADYYEIDGDQTLSAFANYGYSQSHTFVEEKFYGYNMGTNGELDQEADQYGTNSMTYSTYEHGGSFNLGYTFLDLLKLKYTKLYTRKAVKGTRIVDGIMGSNYSHLIKYYLDWEERVLNADQLNGEVNYELFNNKSTFEFGLEHSTANLYQPNNYNYSYVEREGETYIDTSISNHIAKRLKSDDDLLAAYVKNKYYMNMFSEEDYVDVGFTISTKERISRQNKFFLRNIGGTDVQDTDLTGDIESIYYQYVRDNIPYEDRALLVSPLFTPADYFDANVDELNYYVNFFLKPLEKLEVTAGVRYVDFLQTVYQYKEDRTNPDMDLRRLIQEVPEALDVKDFFPSVTAKYKYDESNHFDIALSKTYIVPDLREFTDGEYFHPYEVATVIGNPDLVTTNIYNFDLKYSHYYSETENIKVGAFFKYLDKPIEDVQLPSSSLPIYSFDNADSAILYGIELDGRKSLAFLSNALTNYYLSGNFSYTQSDVSLRAEQLETYTTNHRQLQGLSPTIVNVSLGHDTDDRNVNLSYNKMGERIRKVGVIDTYAYPDYYENPPHTIDLVWIEKFKNYAMKVKAGNLLDAETVWRQGDRITKQFKTGQTVDFSVSARF